MDGEDFKITIEGKEYHGLDDVPEQYREIIRRQVEAARSAAEAAARDAARPGAEDRKNVQIKKHFEIKLNVKRKEAAPSAAGQPSLAAPSADSGRLKIVVLLLIVIGLIAWTLFKRG